MKKCSIFSLAVILTVSIQNSLAQDISLIKTTHLSHYPSASTLEFHQGKLYVIGDDATQALVLDKDHVLVDSIRLFPGSRKKRISKKTKADIESTIIVNRDDSDYLVAFGSLSSSKRNQVLWVDLEDGKWKKTSTFTMNHSDIDEWNIEGTALVNNRLLLTNRANNSSRANHLLVTIFDEKKGINPDSIHSIRLRLPEGKSIMGISSISYLKEKDMILFAASTENTSNAKDDGAIGDSYIGYISNISKKLDQKELRPDEIINITKHLKSKHPQKIESIVVEEPSGKDLIVHLAADNDNGQSMLFKLKWKM
ncbi:MAG TPA: hypothetical protein VGB46_01400 [Flavisolibacter sp.]|jgi:hypothetical protein